MTSSPPWSPPPASRTCASSACATSGPGVHVDLHVDDVGEAADRAVRLGARRGTSPHGDVATMDLRVDLPSASFPTTAVNRSVQRHGRNGHTSLVDQVAWTSRGAAPRELPRSCRS